MKLEPIHQDVQRAYYNWLDWKDVFEHTEMPSRNPVLLSGERWTFFLREYGVQRTIKKGTKDLLRQTLRNKLEVDENLFRSGSYSLIDALDRELRKIYGTHKKPRMIRSVLSKVASFVEPSKFIAWDQFARRGIRKFNYQAPSKNFESYEDYAELIVDSFDGNLGEMIAEICTVQRNEYPRAEFLGSRAFQIRVCDSFLMRIGGRKLSTLS